eukprot:CAMPEP_0114554920 /NCGR_PEP_ID=MMETSP0114-20121206/8469_1 /TAXON_ID=31324 /ORGANISM="Goniomonas sp, Strain m" /LENGTH=514 /DNA_ID=CAMNT_0001740003 /DNA_START=11 /DNA_END=1552 /DNA_ORIENTATION=-
MTTHAMAGLIPPPESPYLVPVDGSPWRLADCPTTAPEDGMSWDKLQKQLHKTVHRLATLQKLLYPSNRSILLVFQAMDAAGKDSTIRTVLSGVNPAGVQVYNFRQPSPEELQHDFLWRVHTRAPEKGRIGVFNRSHYEDVLVLRVHPEFLKKHGLARHSDAADQAPLSEHPLWEERLEAIKQWEMHLARNGTVVLKFMLNVSADVQARRLLARIDDPNKNWKFSPGDLSERPHWAAYMQAYQLALTATSTPFAPWYVVPADKKAFMRERVSDIVYRAMKALQLVEPTVGPEVRERLDEAKRVLLENLSPEARMRRDQELQASEAQRIRHKAIRRANKMRLAAAAKLEDADVEDAGLHPTDGSPMSTSGQHCAPPGGVDGHGDASGGGWVAPMDADGDSSSGYITEDSDGFVKAQEQPRRRTVANPRARPRTHSSSSSSSSSSDDSSSDSSSSSNSSDSEATGNIQWSQISVRQRKAAQVLGYNARTWNNNEETPISVLEWRHLTPEQRSAAKTL